MRFFRTPFFTVLLLALSPISACFAASAEGGTTLDLTAHWAGYLAIVVFVVAYALVMLEEVTHMRKIKAGTLCRRCDLGNNRPGLCHERHRPCCRSCDTAQHS